MSKLSRINPTFVNHDDQCRSSSGSYTDDRYVRARRNGGARLARTSGWKTTTLDQIEEWQEATRLVHVRWSIAQRALTTAEQQCRTMAEQVEIEGIRSNESGFRRTVIASWTGLEAQEEHAHASDMVTRLAMCELIGVIQRIVAEAYRLFLWDNPSLLLDSPETQGLKRLFSRRLEKPDAWEKSWSRHVDRSLEDIRSQRSGSLLLSYWQHAGLKMPDRGVCASVEDLDTAVSLFLAVRENILNHADTVNSGLARLSDLMDFPEFSYVHGSPFVVHGRQIELVEAFFHEYLEILRQALRERMPA